MSTVMEGLTEDQVKPLQQAFAKAYQMRDDGVDLAEIGAAVSQILSPHGFTVEVDEGSGKIKLETASCRLVFFERWA